MGDAIGLGLMRVREGVDSGTESAPRVRGRVGVR